LGVRIQTVSFFPKIRGFPTLVYPIFKNKFPYISLIDEASDFKFGIYLGFAKARLKSHSKKVGIALG